jgi:hypothetical protein
MWQFAQSIISPAFVGLALDVYLMITEISLRPLIANDHIEAFERAVIRPVNDAVTMKTVISTHFQNSDE